MAKSDNLREAKRRKNDEFYTLEQSIVDEIDAHEDYVRQFRGKSVYCNCDSEESSFVRFFLKRFEEYGLKKLTATHWNADGSPSCKTEWVDDGNGPKATRTPLQGDGDFRSEECVEILKEADIVATNPPFSIARELYIPLLFEYEKKFIIIGDLNWVAYKGVFPLFKENKMIFGYNSVKQFRTPDGSMKKFGNKVWFTNLDLDKAHEPLILTKNYYGNEERYPKYDNYDAIECGKVKDIPKDYFPCWYDCPHASECVYAKTEGKTDDALCERPPAQTENRITENSSGTSRSDSATPPLCKCKGIIGVPITFFSGFCPTQFRIIGPAMGWTANNTSEEWKRFVGYQHDVISKEGTRSYSICRGTQMYHRILVQRLSEE